MKRVTKIVKNGASFHQVVKKNDALVNQLVQKMVPHSIKKFKK
jgi:hypothetical protein